MIGLGSDKNKIKKIVPKVSFTLRPNVKFTLMFAGKVTAGWNQARKIFKLSSIVERFEEKTKKK